MRPVVRVWWQSRLTEIEIGSHVEDAGRPQPKESRRQTEIGPPEGVRWRTANAGNVGATERSERWFLAATLPPPGRKNLKKLRRCFAEDLRG